MIKKINKKASGVKVELTNNNKVLKVQGPQQKVDRAWDFLQQLVVTETPVATTYVVIDVVGVDADAKLDSLSQAIGDAGKTIPAEKLHFSVCHSSPSFSASEAIALAEELDEKMKPTTLPRNLNSIFKCNKKVFFNVDGRHQVLGVVPEGTTSPPHQLIKFVQSTLSSSDLDMEATPHVTIINRRSPNAQNSRADQDRRLVAEINKYNCDHDWLGPLTIKGVKVSRQVLDLTTKQLDHFTLWEMVLQ
ncbi:hypothetical protein O0I10_000394 [Lichtheimia ornata]|uniref:Uncharacterized protein n=1 Tax=Lichtheimia ornata TaxID=688661 RepID=A0AAD7Y5H4_9FUNG|nr:uncharacterized protein O0I10_000394 [Lichtheimia ornata]KAJ8664116.1 hypothetical protein O0I10_000394 [Lichtheimia ornata]